MLQRGYFFLIFLLKQQKEGSNTAVSSNKTCNQQFLALKDEILHSYDTLKTYHFHHKKTLTRSD